ncbi:hypothetical protein AVEN_175859-1, partial [Araneus ventricosus]
ESFLKNLLYKTEKEIEKSPYNLNFIKHSDVIENTKCESLAKEVLSTTKLKLPTLTNADDLKVRLHAALQSKAALRTAISKRQTPVTALEDEITDTGSESETTAESSKCETTAESSKCETTGTEVETTDAGSEGETTDAGSEGETTGTGSENTTTVSSNRETADTVSIRKALEAAFKPETTERVSKQKASDSYWKPTAEASSKCETTETVLQRFSNLESETNNAVEQKVRLDWFENIVRTVVEYNNSKYSDPADANNQVQRKADKYLKQLKDMIRSLIDTLEDYEE